MHLRSPCKIINQKLKEHSSIPDNLCKCAPEGRDLVAPRCRRVQVRCEAGVDGAQVGGLCGERGEEFDEDGSFGSEDGEKVVVERGKGNQAFPFQCLSSVNEYNELEYND